MAKIGTKSGTVKKRSSCFALRCHSYGPEEKRLVEVVSAYFRPQDIFIVCDESQCISQVDAEYKKISVTPSVLKSLGLLAHPCYGWLCGDYFYYALQRAAPNYEYYWLCEPDVFFNLDSVSAFFSRYEGVNDDLLVKNFQRARDGWPWAIRASVISDVVYEIFFPLTRLSNRAIGCLLEERVALHRAMAKLKEEKEIRQDWPNDEGFVATVVGKLGLSVGRFADYWEDKGILDYFTHDRLILDRNSADARFRNRLLHPVLGEEKYLAKLARISKTKINDDQFISWVDSVLSPIEGPLLQDAAKIIDETFSSHVKGPRSSKTVEKNQSMFRQWLNKKRSLLRVGDAGMHGEHTREVEVVLHIGTEKTGTTSIQRFFADNRPILAQHGILYPIVPGRANHMRLAAYASNDDAQLRFRKHLGIGAGELFKNFRDSFADELRSEVLESGCERVVLSNEHCHSRLIEREEIERLKELLERFAKRIRIVVYFRRQDKLAVSHYCTLIKVGAIPERILPELAAGEYFGSKVPYYYDHWAVYNNWVSVFGAENVKVRLFESEQLKNLDVVQDFLQAAGFEWDKRFVLPPVMNESLKAEALAFQLQLNKLARKETRFARDRIEGERIVQFLEREYAGKGPLPSRSEAIAFFEHFQVGNLQLKNACFPALDRLFSEDFSMYPEESVGQPVLSVEEAVRIAASLWSRTDKGKNGNKAEHKLVAPGVSAGKTEA